MISSALTQLANQLPVHFPVNPVIGQSVQSQLSSAYAHYHQSLLNDDSALTYITGRGITIESVERFKLGFGDRTLLRELSHHKERTLVRNSLKSTGFIKPNGREIFRGCITFPIKHLNHVVGGYGRLRARNCCWGNSPYLYHLIEEEVLFNEDVLQEKPKSIVLLKSPLEVVSFMQVCEQPCLGFIHKHQLTKEQAALLKSSGVKLVKLCINQDEFWAPNVSKIALTLLSIGIRVKVVELPIWQDVNYYLQVKKGVKVLSKLIQRAQKFEGGYDES